MRTSTKVPASSHLDQSRYRSSSSAFLALDRSNAFVQRKAAVAVAMDRFEREADSVADLVVRRVEERRSNDSVCARPKPTNAPAATAAAPSQAQKKADSRQAAPLSSGVDVGPLRGTGTPLDWSLRSLIEPILGVDLSPVRVHTDGTATRLAKQLGAVAFTAGSHVAFAAGRFTTATRDGLHLLAHELTHVVQQGAAGARLPGVEAPVISRLGFAGDLVQRLSDGEGEPVEKEEEDGGIIAWVLERLGGAARELPGWDLFTVLLEFDPITRRRVERNVETLLHSIPGLGSLGDAIYRRLAENQQLREALSWFDENLAKRRLTGERVREAVRSAKADAGLLVLKNLKPYLEKHLLPLYNDATAFASDLFAKVVGWLRETLVQPLLRHIQTKTRAYPLLCQLLGQDPISGKEVKRTPLGLAKAFLELTEDGAAYLEQLKSSGRLAKLLAWLESKTAQLRGGVEGLRSAVALIWERLNLNAVLEPLNTFEFIWRTLEKPVGEIVSFVSDVVARGWELLKEWAVGKLKAIAVETPGYPLLGVILGKDPITQEPVPPTAENFIRAFMSLVPGGVEKFEELKKAGTIEATLSWLTQSVKTLNLSWKDIVGLFRTAYDGLSIRDLAEPGTAFRRIVALFAEPASRIVRFATEVALKVVEFIFMGILGPTAERIFNLLSRSKQAFRTILADPVAFAGNLVSALGGGLSKFLANIWEHLKVGVVEWLTGSLGEAGITLPAQWDLQGILSLVLQILGVTYPRIREKLVKHLGEPVVAAAEETVDVVQRLVTEGPGFLWDKICEFAGNIVDTVLGGIKEWVVTRIVTAAIMKIALLLNPAGAILDSVLTIYRAIMAFVDQIERIAALVESILNSIADIAEGKLDSAIASVERTMASTLPIIIGFLARYIGLGNVGEAVQKIIGKVRDVVDRAIDKALGFVVSKAKAIYAQGKAVVGSVLEWWNSKAEVKAPDGEKHTICFEGKGAGAHLIVRSEPTRFAEFVGGLTIPEEKESKREKLVEQAKEVDALVAKSGQARVELATKINEKLQALVVPLRELMGESFAMVSTPPVFGKKTDAGFGTSVSAAQLTYKHDKGSPPSPPENATWTALKRRRVKSSTYYIEGHLLNGHLGGTGRDWSNLAPITRKANGEHERRFESFIKDAVNGKGKGKHKHDKAVPVTFSVTAVYGKIRSAGQIQKIRKTEDKEIFEIVEAEQHIPLRFDCAATEITKDGSTGATLKALEEPIKNEPDLDVEFYNSGGRRNLVLDASDVDETALMKALRVPRWVATVLKSRRFPSHEAIQKAIDAEQGTRKSYIWDDIREKAQAGYRIRLYRR